VKFLAILLLFHLQPKYPLVRVKENCLIPKVIGFFKHDTYAMTIGHTIYISCDYKKFVENKRWMTHELQHVRQYEKYKLIGFMSRYIWYSIKYGYNKNPLELEAFQKEE
jgi:hypothetical protein